MIGGKGFGFRLPTMHMHLIVPLFDSKNPLVPLPTLYIVSGNLKICLFRCRMTTFFVVLQARAIKGFCQFILRYLRLLHSYMIINSHGVQICSSLDFPRVQSLQIFIKLKPLELCWIFLVNGARYWACSTTLPWPQECGDGVPCFLRVGCCTVFYSSIDSVCCNLCKNKQV